MEIKRNGSLAKLEDLSGFASELMFFIFTDASIGINDQVFNALKDLGFSGIPEADSPQSRTFWLERDNGHELLMYCPISRYDQEFYPFTDALGIKSCIKFKRSRLRTLYDVVKKLLESNHMIVLHELPGTCINSWIKFIPLEDGYMAEAINPRDGEKVRSNMQEPA